MLFRKTLVALVATALLASLTLARPARADTSDITTPLLISAGVAGAVVLVYLVAIAGSDFSKDPDPEFMFAPLRAGRAEGVRFGPACAASREGPPPLFCW
jgi:hypothetical protein